MFTSKTNESLLLNSIANKRARITTSTLESTSTGAVMNATCTARTRIDSMSDRSRSSLGPDNERRRK